MDPAAAPVATAWAIGGWLGAVAVVALAARYADWPRMLRPQTAHVCLGTVLSLVILWLVRATFGGASLHFLGIGALTLSAGPGLALVGGSVVVAATSILGGAPVANAGLAFLSLVAVPVCVQWTVLLVVRRTLPRNPFAWFFGVAFFGGGASFFAGALAGGALGTGLAIGWSEYALVVLMLAFGEGTLTGMLLTLAVVYRPAWVATFDDSRDLEKI